MFPSYINDVESKVRYPPDSLIFDNVTKDKRQQPGKNKLRFFSTGSSDLLINGIDVELDMSFNPEQCKDFLKQKLQEYVDAIIKSGNVEQIRTIELIKDISAFDLLIYTVGGIPFLGGQLGSIYDTRKFPTFKHYIYGILTRPFNGKNLSTTIYDVCNVSDDLHKKLLSPLCDSTMLGLCDIACLFGYLNNFGAKNEKLLKSCAAIIKFSPLITSLYRLNERKSVTYRDIITISSTFHTYFNYLIKSVTPPEKTFEYALRCCNIITHIKNIPKDIPLKTIDLASEKGNYQYLVDLNQPETVYIWQGDFDADFDYVEIKQIDHKAIEQANKNFASFSPIAPLSIRIVNSCSIVKGKEHSFLYLQQSSGKGDTDTYNIIDPTEGDIKSVDLDEFAIEQENSECDNVANLIDPDKVEQVILVCFDRSGSMSNSLDGNDPSYFDNYIDDEDQNYIDNEDQDYNDVEVDDDEFKDDDDDDTSPNKKLHSVPSRCTIAMQYLTCFANNTYGYRIPCILGLISFNDVIDYRCPLSPLIPDFEEKGLKGINPEDLTKLWDVIIFACKRLNEFTKDENGNQIFPNAKNRIIVISDGEDTDSVSNSVEATKELLENGIILDSVNINSTNSCTELAVVSHISGGVAINPTDISQGLKFFESDTFLNINLRKENLKPIIPGKRNTIPKKLKSSDITRELINEAMEHIYFDENIVDKQAIRSTTVTKYVTPRYYCSIKKNSAGLKAREKRILRELHFVALAMDKNGDSYDPDVVVLPYDSNFDIWKVFIKGPEMTNYENKWFNLLLTFPKLYPIEPPSIRFISVPYNLNVSNEGRICLEVLEKGYIPSFHVIGFIQQIKQIFLYQNPEWAISIEILDKFLHDREEYDRLAIESANEKGKDDYNEFLPTKKIINDNIADGFELIYDKKDQVPIYMVSQISGRIYKDPVKVPSVGVTYEREEIRQLIATSRNPTCIITGLPITESLNDIDALLPP